MERAILQLKPENNLKVIGRKEKPSKFKSCHSDLIDIYLIINNIAIYIFFIMKYNYDNILEGIENLNED